MFYFYFYLVIYVPQFLAEIYPFILPPAPFYPRGKRDFPEKLVRLNFMLYISKLK